MPDRGLFQRESTALKDMPASQEDPSDPHYCEQPSTLKIAYRLNYRL